MAAGNWIPHQSGHSWYKNSGIYRQEVSGPCFIDEDGTPKYFRKRNRTGSFIFNYVISRHSDLGRFVPPRWNESRELIHPGTFITEKTHDGYSLFESCQGLTPSVIDQIEEQNQPEPTPEPTYTDVSFSSISMIDWRIALAIALVVVIVIVAVIQLKKK